MSIPRMNWKRFISTGVLEPTQTHKANGNLNTRVEDRVNKNASSSPQEKKPQINLTEAERLIAQNKIIINAINDQNHPFHMIAESFVQTQLFDSRHFVNGYFRNEREMKKTNQDETEKENDKTHRALQRKIRQLEKQILIFESVRVHINKR